MEMYSNSTRCNRPKQKQEKRQPDTRLGRRKKRRKPQTFRNNGKDAQKILESVSLKIFKTLFDMALSNLKCL